MLTILITGFGPFPGAPVNPTGPLVERVTRLARVRYPKAAFASHVFRTSYAAVDLELPDLLKRLKPDALVMFGLAPRASVIRVETLARNSVSFTPDVDRLTPPRRSIAAGAPSTMTMPAPARHVHAALRRSGIPAVLSHNAGTYLCNYLSWRGAESANRPAGPSLVIFIHVPMVRLRQPRRVTSGLGYHRLLHAAGIVIGTAITTCQMSQI
jgi:pyroglutamyl-peptidase